MRDVGPTRSERIAALVADLTPGFGPPRAARDASIWLLFSWSSALALIWLLGPFRTGALAQWVSSPRFQLETVVVVLVSVAGGGLAALAAIPARTSARRALAIVLALLLGLRRLFLAVGRRRLFLLFVLVLLVVLLVLLILLLILLLLLQLAKGNLQIAAGARIVTVATIAGLCPGRPETKTARR